MKLSQAIKIIAIIGWLVALAVFLYAYVHHRITLHFVEHLSDILGWKAGLIYILAYAVRPFVFFPASIMTPLAAVLFGPWVGFGYAFLAENFSAAVTFFVSRYFGRNLIEQSSNEFLKKYDKALTENGFDTVVFLRLIPVFPFDFINLASGLSGISFRNFFLATVVGTLPGLAAYVFLGGSIHDRKFFVLSLLSFGLVYILSRFYKQKRNIQ